MPNIRLRGLDHETPTALKKRAAKENVSVNLLVLRLIDHGLGRKIGTPVRERHGDLDALAGSWRKEGILHESITATKTGALLATSQASVMWLVSTENRFRN